MTPTAVCLNSFTSSSSEVLCWSPGLLLAGVYFLGVQLLVQRRPLLRQLRRHVLGPSLSLVLALDRGLGRSGGVAAVLVLVAAVAAVVAVVAVLVTLLVLCFFLIFCPSPAPGPPPAPSSSQRAGRGPGPAWRRAAS